MPKRTLAALRQPSLKLTIIAIVFVVLVPTLGVIAATLYSASRSFEEASTRQLLETARTVARSTINELELTASVLQNVAQLQALDDDLQLQRRHSAQFANGVYETHVLVRLDGQWQTAYDDGDVSPSEGLALQAAQTGRMQVSDIVASDDPAHPLQVVLAMPHVPSHNMVQVSTLTTAPEHLIRSVARQTQAGDAVILAITDSQGRILGRSVDGPRLIGKPVPDWQRLQQQPGDSGAFLAQTLEGGQIVFAFQRIEGTPGWVAVVGESAVSFNRRWQQPILVMLLASGVTVLVALALASLLARKVLQPIRLLASRAQRIAAGEQRAGERLMADVPPSFVAEFEVLRHSLDEADQVLQQSLQESQRAEQQMQEHLAVLQAAEQQAKLGHWSLDLKTGQLHVSEMLSVLYGGPRQASVMDMQALRQRLTPDSFEAVQTAVWQCAHQGTSYALEVEHLRLDGGRFSAFLRGDAVRDAQGQVVAIQGTLQDISEGKEQSERLAALADNLPSGVIFRFQRKPNKDLVLQFLSAGLESLTGLSASATVRNQGLLLQAIPGVHLRRVLRVLRHAVRPGHMLDAEFPLHTRDGAVIWIHCRAALRYPGMGGAVWDGIARDVTAERAAADALHAAKDAAESAERAKSDFLATMSHEIRTPMNSVIGMSRLAMRTNLDDKQRNYLEKINESANVLLGIINDILDFSKIEAGGMVLEGAPFKLEAVLETVSSVTALKAEEKGLEITYVVEPGTPSMLCGDALRLGQVLTNLVSNAVKFTEAGEVVVSVRALHSEEGPLLHFAVRDSGIGLSQEQAARLFQPFTQAQTNTSHRYGGTGLGLAISKRLVEMMGGEIGLHSVQGEGSTFFFTVRMLPVVGEGTEGNVTNLSLQGARILIADDNATARMALAEMAVSFGMHTTLASHGLEAVELLRSHAAQGMPFDIVVLDWRMPVMDGVEAARCIKEDAHLERMPAVLMVTAYGQDAMQQAAAGLSLQGVLIKPVTQSAMFNTLLQATCAEQHPALHLKAAYEPSDVRPFAALRGKRVLVADDNALNREVATDFLAVVGVEVQTAVDGRDAIRHLETQDFDAVLMDIHMPQLDGLAATQEIRRHARWSQLPIIALTAQARSEDVLLSRDAGMNGHLTKPIDEMALYRCLMQYCAAASSGDAEEVSAVAESPGHVAAVRTSMSAGEVPEPPFARLARSPVRRAHLLRGFLQDFSPLPANFAHQLANGQWSELAALVHQIKGSASYLGATELCAVADVVEHAARQGDRAVVQQHAMQFVALVEACLEDVRGAVAQLQSQDTAVPPVEPSASGGEAVMALIARMRPLVQSGNFAAHGLLEELVAHSAGRAWATVAQAALDAFDDLEREQTLRLLTEIQQQCEQVVAP